MDEETEDTNKVKNSEVIKRTLYSLFFVARSKTSKDYAWSMIKRLLTELKTDYIFLKYIQIGEIEKLTENIDDITIMSDFNNVEPQKIGSAIQNLVDIFRTRMGAKAGYFFLTEFKEALGEKYNLIIKNMGVDLRLLDLRNEIYGWAPGEYKIKDKHDSNIGYLEKEE